MLDRDHVRHQLAQLFARTPVADLQMLQATLGTPSRTTVFRILSDTGYLTSYSHAGRYYTLEEIPQFDADGLWAHGDILFSRHHTLRRTIVHFVEGAAAGHTQTELQAKLRLRVHDTLYALVRANQVTRTELARLYLYLSADRERAQAQLGERRRLFESLPKFAPLPEPTLIIEVLLGVIHHPRLDPMALASRLHQQGKAIAPDQIAAVLAAYGVKKTAPPPSRRSRR
jgi:hypothetical protein